MNSDYLRQEHLAFLKWDALWFELERHKRDKAYYNVVFSLDDLKKLMAQSWWYELYIPPGYMELRFDRLALWREIAAQLLKGYLDRFYQFRQTIAFLDPKGLRNFTDTFNNPKVQLARRIKKLESDLRRNDIRLESFLISQTHRDQLRWVSPLDPSRQAAPAEYKEHHIILAKDEPDTYIRDLIGVLSMNIK